MPPQLQQIPAETSPTDVTSVLESPSAPSTDGLRKVHLVEGSGSGFTGEVCDVLRSRLRIAALLLATGLGLFLVWGLFRFKLDDFAHITGFFLHLFATASCGYAAYALCRKCVHSHAKLRFFEYAIFGVVGIFFLFTQYMGMSEEVSKGHFTRNMGPWPVLIFTYALLIPNTWRRALPMLLTFSLAPLIVSLAVFATNANARELIATDGFVFVEFLLSSIITFSVAIVGVHSINELRTDAYEARRIGQYRLKGLLGAGGMGEVHLAEHRMMKRPCAIKLIRPDKAGDPLTLARFEREVRATAKLSHWNTIDIFDYGRTDDGTFYYVMEYLPGMNLNELVRKFGPMSPERVVYLMRQASDALTEAHKLNIIHRDLKPANIFAAVRGGLYDVVKLLDFGLAKPLHSLDSANLTQEGSITGSPLFMSPEQATGDQEPDMRSDIYSLGAVMYFLLTGHAPFEYDKPLKVIVAHSMETPLPISEHVPNVPDELQQIVMRCLEKNPDDRFQQSEQLMFALESLGLARDWSRARAAHWWTERCSEEICYPEPPIASADLTMNEESVVMTYR